MGPALRSARGWQSERRQRRTMEGEACNALMRACSARAKWKPCALPKNGTSALTPGAKSGLHDAAWSALGEISGRDERANQAAMLWHAVSTTSALAPLSGLLDLLDDLLPPARSLSRKVAKKCRPVAVATCESKPTKSTRGESCGACKEFARQAGQGLRSGERGRTKTSAR